MLVMIRTCGMEYFGFGHGAVAIIVYLRDSFEEHF